MVFDKKRMMHVLHLMGPPLVGGAGLVCRA